MSIYQGVYYSATFSFVDSNGAAVNISGWTFEADFRVRTTDTTSLLRLTTANTGFVVTDGPNGLLQVHLTEEQTEQLPLGRVVFDVIRTDEVAGPRRYFGGSVKVKQPVTRDD